MRTALTFLVLLSSIYLGSAQNYSQLFDQVKETVVVITTTEKVPTSSGNVLYSVDSRAQGSGVVVSEEGYILTAAHVVHSASKILVRFHNGEEVPADVVNSAPMADVALIKLTWKPKTLKVAPVGDSDKSKIGEAVFVIGAPYGLDYSISTGIISRRSNLGNTTASFMPMEFFQTDAAINQGNSGGPMFNIKGEVIGVVSHILTQSGGFEGVGFAVTSNIARKILIDENSLWFGIEGEIIVSPFTEMLNVDQDMALLVEKVVPLSPAGIAGIKGGILTAEIGDEEFIIGGDIILSVGGYPLNSIENLGEARKHLGLLEKGTYIDVGILRAGRKITLKLKIPGRD